MRARSRAPCAAEHVWVCDRRIFTRPCGSKRRVVASAFRRTRSALLVAPAPRGQRPARRDMGCGLSRVEPGHFIPPVPTTAAKADALERDVPSAGKASENNKFPSSKNIEATVAPELLGYPVPTAKVAPGGDHIIASADSPVPPILAAASESFAASSMKKAQSFRNRRLSIDAAAMSDAKEAHSFRNARPASDALLDEY